MLGAIKNLLRTEFYECLGGSRNTILGDRVLVSDDASIIVLTTLTSKGTSLNWLKRYTNEKGDIAHNLIASVENLDMLPSNKDSLAISNDGLTVVITSREKGKVGLNIYKVSEIENVDSATTYIVRLLDRIAPDSLIIDRYGESITISGDGNTVASVGVLVNGFVIVYFYDKVTAHRDTLKTKYDLRIKRGSKNGGSIVLPPFSNGKTSPLSRSNNITIDKSFENIPKHTAKVVMDSDANQVVVLVDWLNDDNTSLLSLISYVKEDGSYVNKGSVSLVSGVYVADCKICMSKTGNRVMVSTPKTNSIYSIDIKDGEILADNASILSLGDEYTRLGDSIAISGDGNTLVIGEAGTLDRFPIYYIYEYENGDWKYIYNLNGYGTTFRVGNSTAVSIDYHGVTIATGEKDSYNITKDGKLACGALQITNL